MPVIQEYNRQFSTAGPIQERRRTADDFGAAEARGLGRLGQGVQSAGQALQRRAEQEELSDLNAKLSKVQADNAIEFQELVRTAKPGDKKVFEDFDKRAQKRLDDVQGGIETGAGRNYFNNASSKISNQLRVNAAQTQADLDGEKAVIDYTQSKNNLSAGLVSDPSSLEVSRDLHRQGIDNLVNSGLLSARDAEKLKLQGDRDLIKSSIRGWAKLDPEFAKEKLKSGEYDKELGGDLKVQMFGEVEQAIRAKDVEAQRQERRQKELKEAEQLKTQNTFLEKMSENNLTVADILDSNLDAFGPGSKEQFIRMVQKTNEKGGKLQTNPNTFIEIFDRINLPDGDPKKITDEAQLNDFLGEGLNYTDLTKLRQEITGRKTEKGRVESDMRKQLFNIAKGHLTRSNALTGVRDPDGDESMLRFQTFVYEQVEEQRKAGKPIRDLLNPDSKDYLGRFIRNYKRSPQEIMRAQMRELQGTKSPSLQNTLNSPAGQGAKPKPPRNPNESISEYLDRINKGGQ